MYFLLSISPSSCETKTAGMLVFESRKQSVINYAFKKRQIQKQTYGQGSSKSLKIESRIRRDCTKWLLCILLKLHVESDKNTNIYFKRCQNWSKNEPFPDSNNECGMKRNDQPEQTSLVLDVYSCSISVEDLLANMHPGDLPWPNSPKEKRRI